MVMTVKKGGNKIWIIIHPKANSKNS